jgi:organic hydroperoxide reductase OsmC/OhrA
MKMAEPFTYRCSLEWSGSNKEYNTFDRNHRVAFEGKAGLTMTAAPEYKGDPTKLDPEDLLVAALASCQMLTFLAIASMSKVEVLAYRDAAVGKVEKADGKMKMTTVVLKPKIVLAPGSNLDRAAGLVTKAHEQCFIANSVTTQVVVEPEFEVR